jgi:ankyrin repeat protein
MRRQMQFRLKQGELISRRQPTPQEAKKLFDSIDHNKTSDFGLVKLAQFGLDQLWPVPDYKREHGGTMQTWAPGITFVAYAAHRGNDAALAALLRAGADASVRYSRAALPDTPQPVTFHLGSEEKLLGEEGECGFPSASLPFVSDYLSHVPGPFAAWLVKQVVTMRRLAGSGTNLMCQLCEGLSLPLVWEACNHCVCEPCFWRLQQEQDLEFTCACIAPTAISKAAVPLSLDQARARREESYRKWSELPVCKEDIDRKQKKEIFRALDRVSAAGAGPGRTRPQRMEQFLKAVEEDDVLRVEALIGLGVDVDGSNECGESALLVAAWLGHTEVARTLLAAGADPLKVAHGGYSVLSIARSRGHLDLLSVLTLAGVQVGGECSFEYCATDECILAQPCPLHGKGFSNGPCDVTVLFSPECSHPGKGSLYADGGFPESFLQRLEALWASIPLAPGLKVNNRSYADTCATRSFFCDAEGWVSAHVRPLAAELLGLEVSVLPRMRFLYYGIPGGDMQPHTDLAKKNLAGVSSTHTFMLHLADCEEGGETVFLEKLPPARNLMTILAKAQPRRGRLLLFPHVCPHAGLPVLNLPPRKLFLRGELLCGSGNDD